jgi:pyruvate kinase
LEALLKAGMNVARINMSHGSHAGHAKVIRDLRAVARRLGVDLAILLDLQGPKIRVGRMQNGKVQLRAGDRLRIVTRALLGTPEQISTSYRKLPHDCRPGDPILLDDGKLRLRVTAVAGNVVTTRVEVGGWLKDHKGMNLPGVALSTPSVTAKDMEDLRFGLEHGVDYVALSFVRHPDDVLRVKRYIASQGYKTPVIAKIEKPEALEHLRAITLAADAIMVARGDLGVELALDKVPLIQKEIIVTAHQFRRPVITATQMLESMTDNPSPTRAEASDVANAILDGTDAVMLSGETAAGRYPVEACTTMAAICASTESSALYRQSNALRQGVGRQGRRSVAEAVCYAARAATEELRIRAIVCFTKRGKTARYLSKLRPEVPIYAFTPDRDAVRQMGLYWGVQAAFTPRSRNTDRLHQMTTQRLLAEKKVRKGDLLVMVSGMPIGLHGTINMLKIHEV